MMTQTVPDLEPEKILKMVTLHPAEAIGMKGKLGELSPGACADMISIPFEKKEGLEKDIYEAVLNNCKKTVNLNTAHFHSPLI